MKLLLTGGCGYLGSALVDFLLKNTTYEIIILDNLYKGRTENIAQFLIDHPKRVTFYKKDIREYDFIENLMKETTFDIVIHTAAIVDAFNTNAPDKEILCDEVIHQASVKLCELAKKHGVKRFLHTSTVSLYSSGDNLTEDAPKEPISNYGKSKYKAETKIMKMNNDTFQITSLRPATIFGFSTGFRYETVLNLFMMNAFCKVKLPVFDQALIKNKTYLDINDICRAFKFCIDHPEKTAGECFNIVSFSDNLTNYLELLKKHFPDVEIEIIKTHNISQKPYTISGEKFYKAGFKPKHDLEGQIKKVKQYLTQQYEINNKLLK